jgi:NAD(P)-dependent dehydrogenase (short-subunit alcohol dehydrogenase family)
VYIADRDIKEAESLATTLNSAHPKTVAFGQADVAEWDQQVHVFEQAIATFGRVDYVYPIAGIGERAWLPPNTAKAGWIKPDLKVCGFLDPALSSWARPFLISGEQVIDVNLTGT